MNSLNHILARKLRKAKNKKQNGFTLIELMVVVAIVGVLSSVALPQLTKAQDRAKASAAQQEVVNAAKTCSIALLAGEVGTNDAPIDIGTNTVTGTCNAGQDLVATGGGKQYTVTIDSNGVPGTPQEGNV